MSQMTEASKKRIEETSEKYVDEHYPPLWSTGAPKYSPSERMIASLGYQTGYQAGMQDPDANKELMEENKRLKKALKEISNSSPTLEAAMRTAHFVLGLQLPDDLKFKEDTRNDKA